MAAQRGHLEVVRCLVKEFAADVNEARAEGKTPLCIAAYNGHFNVVLFIVTVHAKAWAQILQGCTTQIFSELKMRAESSVRWLGSMSWLLAPVAMVVTSAAILASFTRIAMLIYKRDLDLRAAHTRLQCELDVAAEEMVLQQKTELLSKQQHQRELEMLRRQHAAALKSLRQEAASEQEASQKEASVALTKQQKDAAATLKHQRRLTAAKLSEGKTILDVQKKEFMKAQQRLREESADALKQQHTQMQEEAVASLEYQLSEGSRERRMLQATF
jgi:ribosomal protein L7/L12